MGNDWWQPTFTNPEDENDDLEQQIPKDESAFYPLCRLLIARSRKPNDGTCRGPLASGEYAEYMRPLMAPPHKLASIADARAPGFGNGYPRLICCHLTPLLLSSGSNTGFGQFPKHHPHRNAALPSLPSRELVYKPPKSLIIPHAVAIKGQYTKNSLDIASEQLFGAATNSLMNLESLTIELGSRRQKIVRYKLHDYVCPRKLFPWSAGDTERHAIATADWSHRTHR
ncbi:hypothetical protein F5Y12DRAFT_715316 [Xylaria sp. FL1777]|nr:hypothetical protein F5Y12DRAFT_715316 [Xylaria sp. FL1777]